MPSGLLFLSCPLYFSPYSRLGSVVRFVVALKPQGPRFDSGLANDVYRTMRAITLGVDARINTKVQNISTLSTFKYLDKIQFLTSSPRWCKWLAL